MLTLTNKLRVEIRARAPRAACREESSIGKPAIPGSSSEYMYVAFSMSMYVAALRLQRARRGIRPRVVSVYVSIRASPAQCPERRRLPACALTPLSAVWSQLSVCRSPPV